MTLHRAFLLTLLVCCVPTVAVAQTSAPPPLGVTSAHSFSPAPGRGNFFAVDGATTPGHLTGAAGLYLDYAHRPFVLQNASCRADSPTSCMTTGTARDLVRFTLTTTLVGAITLINRLQLGLTLPIIYGEGDSFQYMNEGGSPVTIAPGFSTGGIGDMRVSLKGRIYGAGEGVSFGALVFVGIPTANMANPGRFFGNATASVGGSLIGEFQHRALRIAANIGGYWREQQTYLSTVTGPQLTYGVAASYNVTPLIAVLGELTGASTFSSQVDENTLEFRAGGQIQVGDFLFSLGGGAGLLSGVGVPNFRVLGSAMWAPERPDSDQDQVMDREDACPTEPEDRDGFNDTDGCPENDNDDDGIPDESDRCPNDAEDRDNIQDDDGCPDRDNDNDGVQDGYDSCPAEPEDMDGDRDDDGCPDNDRDRDNINDDVDQCPDQAEDTDGYGDEDGCPETDFDTDSVPDDADQCPDQAEDTDGFEDSDGCPEEGSGRRRGGR